MYKNNNNTLNYLLIFMLSPFKALTRRNLESESRINLVFHHIQLKRNKIGMGQAKASIKINLRELT